jgi:hypothetical protein
MNSKKRILVIDSSIGGSMLETNLNRILPKEVQVDVEQEAQGAYDVIFIATYDLLSNPLTVGQLKKKHGSPSCKIVAVTNESIPPEMTELFKKVDGQIQRSLILSSETTELKALMESLNVL